MARFPRTEAEIIALAEAMVSGLTGNAAVYPAKLVLKDMPDGRWQG